MPDQLPPMLSAQPLTALRVLAPAAQFVFRGRTAAVRAASELFCQLPDTPCQAVTSGSRTALWQGPDEWLLLAPAGEQATIETAFADALAGIPHALVAVSHRNIMLELAGPDATAMINAGCPLNLSHIAFPPGMCTRTIVAKAPIVLWRTAPETFIIGVWRSFAPYVQAFLLEARTRL